MDNIKEIENQILELSKLKEEFSKKESKLKEDFKYYEDRLSNIGSEVDNLRNEHSDMFWGIWKEIEDVEDIEIREKLKNNLDDVGEDSGYTFWLPSTYEC